MLQKIHKTSRTSPFNHRKCEMHLNYLFDYQDEILKEKIFCVKKSLPEGIQWAADNLFTVITGNTTKGTDKIRIGIVPIPSRTYYRREKDHDHMLVVAKEIKRKAANSILYNINVDILDCLIPLTFAQQKKLTKEEREKRKEHMFTIDPIIKLLINRKKYTHVWIIDDVITTGSTLVEASRLIESHINHQKLYVIGLAH